MEQGWDEPAPRGAGWNDPAPRADGTAGNTDLGMLCPRKHTALSFRASDWQFYCFNGDMIQSLKLWPSGRKKLKQNPQTINQQQQ